MIEINDSLLIEKDLSYADILQAYGDGFIDQLLRISIGIAIFNIYVFFYTRDMDTIPWKEYIETHSTDRQMLSMMILKSGSMIAMILSLFFPILIIGYKTGWYI